MNQRLRELKYLIQKITNQKSVKVGRDGKISIIYKFNPNQLLVGQDCNNLQKTFLDQIESITNIKYKITRTQKEPSYCYNTYTRLLSIPNSCTPRLRKFLKNFEKTPSGKFEKKSYSEIHIFIQPLNSEDFAKFLITED